MRCAVSCLMISGWMHRVSWIIKTVCIKFAVAFLKFKGFLLHVSGGARDVKLIIMSQSFREAFFCVFAFGRLQGIEQKRLCACTPEACNLPKLNRRIIRIGGYLRAAVRMLLEKTSSRDKRNLFIFFFRSQSAAKIWAEHNLHADIPVLREKRK